MRRSRALAASALVLLAILASPAARAELRKSLITGRIRFRVFTLIRNPAGQPAGSIGATGEDFTVTIPGANPRDARIGGNYMTTPPARGTVLTFI